MNVNHKVFESINTLSEFLSKEPQDIVSYLTFFMPEGEREKVVNAYNTTVEFRKLSLEERAKSLGFEYRKTDEGEEVSAIL